MFENKNLFYPPFYTKDKISKNFTFKNDSFNELENNNTCFYQKSNKEKSNYQSRTKYRITVNLNDSHSQIKQCFADFVMNNNPNNANNSKGDNFLLFFNKEKITNNNSSVNNGSDHSLKEKNEKDEFFEDDDNNLSPPPLPINNSFNNNYSNKDNFSSAKVNSNNNELNLNNKIDDNIDLLRNEFESIKLSDEIWKKQDNENPFNEKSKGQLREELNPNITKKLSKLPYRYLPFP